jgi:sugar lactone lactonase YvrE
VANGLALNGGYLYAADSVLGTIWRAPVGGGQAVAWSTAPELAQSSLAGANGLAVHNGAVWTTNTDTGSVVRVPVERDRSAGAATVVATGLGLIDDIEFTGGDDTLLVAGIAANEVLLVRPDGSHTVVLTGADGLQNPTSLARRGDTVYIGNAAYFTGVDPNVLTARLSC